MSKSYFTDESGNEFCYALCYLDRGWDEEKYSNSIDELDEIAKNMVTSNSGKPLIIVSGNDEVVKEYTKKLK